MEPLHRSIRFVADSHLNGAAVALLERVSAVEAEGTWLNCVTVGEGKPVIVVHGGPGLGHSYLRPGLDALADKFRLIYYDQRGSGRSEPGESAQGTLAEAIADLDAVRRGFGIEKGNLLGHSFGAIVALLYSVRYAHSVASLVLANPGPPFDPDQQAAQWAEMQRRTTPQDGEKLEQIMKSEEFEQRDPKTMEEFIRIVYSPFFRDRSFVHELKFDFSQLSADSVVGKEEAWMKELESLDVIGSAGRVSSPAMVVRSELDPIPQEFARFLADKIAGAEFHLAPGANHFAYAEDPDTFIPAVADFLGRRAL